MRPFSLKLNASDGVTMMWSWRVRNRQFLDPAAGAPHQVGEAGDDPIPRRPHGLRLNPDLGNRIGRIGGRLQIDEDDLEVSRFGKTALQLPHEAGLAHPPLCGQQGVSSFPHPLFQRFQLRLPVEEVLSVDPVAPALSNHGPVPTILLASTSLATSLLSTLPSGLLDSVAPSIRPSFRRTLPAAQPARRPPRSTVMRQPPPGGPRGKAQNHRTDGDRHRTEQPSEHRRRHGKRAQRDAGPLGAVPVAQPPEPAAAERQRQAAGGHHDQRRHRYQSCRRPHGGFRWPVCC